jgi:hypothetical protein
MYRSIIYVSDTILVSDTCTYVLVLRVLYVKKIPCFSDFLKLAKIIMGAPISLPIKMLQSI